MTRQAGVQLTSTDEQIPLISQQQQQQEIINTLNDSDDVNYSRRPPNLPIRALLAGSRDDYLKYCLPIYEASIKCDWNAAKAILDKYEGPLTRYSIIENGGTALHVAAASAKFPQNIGEVFVKNLVDLMKREDLALENENYNTALYLGAVAGNLEAVKIMVKKNRDLVTIPGAGGQMLPLYAAALSGKYDVVKYLFKMSNDLCDEDGWNRQNRGWLVEKCVENDMFDVALEIVKKYPELGCRGSVLGILAQKPDALIADRKPHPIISIVIKKMVHECIDSDSNVEAQESQALQLLRFILDDIVVLPKNEIDSILINRPNAFKQANKPASDQALELQKLISEHIVNIHVETQNIIEQDSKSTNFIKGDQVVQLEKVISEHITKMQVKTQNIIRGPTASKTTQSSGALFTAAETGNTIFLVELIRRYPEIMWKVNDSNQTIFHIAVENRHESIYNMLYEIGYMKDSITSLDDENGNNMLHLVAKIPKKKKLTEVPGVMFQMQRELLWYKEVKSMINPSCRERKNKEGLTPHELFTKEHEDLLSQSEKWVKETANQCVVAATLVATIAFAAAITVPGGYNLDNGIPIFYRDPAYTIFIVADAISLFASSASIFIFITILTSRFAERDFLESIPKKFTVLLATLFYSITTMTMSFTFSFFAIYRKELTWIPILIATLAVLPVLLYGKLQYALFKDAIQSTYGSRYLFKPRKPVLYYQNPVL